MTGEEAWKKLEEMQQFEYEYQNDKCVLKYEEERARIFRLNNNTKTIPKDTFIEWGNSYFGILPNSGSKDKPYGGSRSRPPHAIIFFKFLSSRNNLAQTQASQGPETIDETDHKISSLRCLVRVRLGQQSFRDKLMAAYRRQCAITGCTVEAVLEAAHIEPYSENENQDIENGILLRSDIHLLFDSGLIWIDVNYLVHTAEELNKTEYNQLEGRRISLPDNKRDYPSSKHIAWRNQNRLAMKYL